jgi:hypothetical protein
MARPTVKELKAELRNAKAELKPLTQAASAACRAEAKQIKVLDKIQARIDKLA